MLLSELPYYVLTDEEVIKETGAWVHDSTNSLLESTQLISESYNNSHNRVKITPQGGVTIFGVDITPKRSNFFL